MDGLGDGLVAAFVGGFAGFLTAVVSNLFERRKDVDKSVRDARLEVYALLWHKFGFIPRWPRGSVTPTQLQELSASLRDWYFGVTPETALATRHPGNSGNAGDDDGGSGGLSGSGITPPGGMFLSTKSRTRYNEFQDVIQNMAERRGDQPVDRPVPDELYDVLQDRVSKLRAEITEDLLSRRRQFLTR